MHTPLSTYRIQLHKGFTFNDLQQILDYLHLLGITTIYAAPVFEATPGSMHGYDVTDPHNINPEIGTVENLRSIATQLKDKGMTWIQDIVPNHMAFNPFNTRLMDVLERGIHSDYYNYFDIDWNHPAAHLKGKVMVPFLGDDAGRCIENDQIKLSLSSSGITVDYFDNKYPLSVPAYALLKDYWDNTGIQEMIEELVRYSQSANNLVEWRDYKKRWWTSLSQDVLEKISCVIRDVNKDKKKLGEILAHQYYILCHWKQTEKEINYRRFFTVNSLICLRMEDEKVFQEYHLFLYSLYIEKIIQGLRIDHIDGLSDPSLYTQRLRKLFGEECYVIAEKILEAKEEMPDYWPLQGTSGYEFLSYVSQLFTDRKGAKQLIRFYDELVPDMPDYSQLVLENKSLILHNHMAGEWENLVQLFFSLGLANDLERQRLKDALAVVMLCLPVYRIYPDKLPLRGKSLLLMHETFEKARKISSEYEAELSYFRSLFETPPENPGQHDKVLLFLRRFMQFTGPLTAKGVEDTTFYVYNPLISHDEVGDSPSTLGITIQEFHAKMIARSKLSPLSLNATATHDTKRGEDARLRLNVLSELGEAWQDHIKQWRKMNEPFHLEVDGKTAPTVNDEYFLYQSIIGGFPQDFMVHEEWIDRLEQYFIKVVREAKVNSNWETPNEAYEEGCKHFIRQMFSGSGSFLNSFLPFIRIIASYAYTYSLCQVLVKLTAPGIPDIYQGCELWDLSYVDPDNRRGVDYVRRKEYLGQIMEKEQEGTEILLNFLKTHRSEGFEKLFITWKVLNARKKYSKLFLNGDYIPLRISGAIVTSMAYARNADGQWLIVVVPLDLVKSNLDENEDPDRFIQLPDDAPKAWNNLFTDQVVHSHKVKSQFGNNVLIISEIFGSFPVALLMSI